VRTRIPARWVAILVFILSSVLNYLDRQVLATMVDIWRTRPDFPFTYSDYGLLLTVFSISYAVSALFMGWFVDRAGLNRGATIGVALWAIASFGTGTSHSVGEMLVWRALLGVAEAGAIAAVTKAIGMYLLPKERAVGQAMSQLGLSLGAGLAPRFALFFAYQYSWRWTFFAAALLSLAWIPVWLATSRAVRPARQPEIAKTAARSFGLFADPKLWALIVANMLGMTIYSLWSNWPPTYLIHVHHLTPLQAGAYTWIPPIAAYFGGLLGGSVSWGLVRRGMTPVAARKRACFVAALLLLGTAAIPLLPTPALATAGISLSFFLVAAWSVNHYTLPIDIYGARSVGFAVSTLVFAYGLMQAVVSTPLARVIEIYGFEPICFVFALLPLAGYALVHFTVRDDAGVDAVASLPLEAGVTAAPPALS